MRVRGKDVLFLGKFPARPQTLFRPGQLPAQIHGVVEIGQGQISSQLMLQLDRLFAPIFLQGDVAVTVLHQDFALIQTEAEVAAGVLPDGKGRDG